MKVGFVQLDVSRCWKQNLLQIRRALEEDCPELVVWVYDGIRHHRTGPGPGV